MKAKVSGLATFSLALLILIITTAATAYAQNPRVKMETSKGTIVLELDQKAAPKTVDNFLAYVRNGHYDGTVFHRVIQGFMIQGGGFSAEMKQKTTQAPVANEADNGLKNSIGTIAMARTSDPDSATSQFFINTAENTFLNHTAKTTRGWGYCVFGKVIEGLETVKAIESSPTTLRAGYQDVPNEPIVIQKMAVIESVQTLK